jgi:phage tail sheath protein FI
MSGQTTGTTIPNKLIALAETRKDCIVFASPQQNDVVNNYNGELTSVTATVASYTKSSYAFIDSGYKYQFDKYNNVYRWVPLNGDIAGLCARTDADRDPWFSPAGSTRGVIKNVVKLAWNPTASQRDTLYKNSINPVVTFSGEGTILYGDKTLQTGKSSAFDRINVRRLFIILEQSISRAARSSLFEFNDEFTRAAFVNLVEPYLREVKGRRGIYDYRVICDTTNNTSAIIDNNEFVGDIYIKPARSINFIQLNFVAVGTGVAFDEIVGRF